MSVAVEYITQSQVNKFYSLCDRLCAIPTCNPYAKAYARAGYKMHDADSIRVQILYIRSNMAQMKGPAVKQLKVEFDELKGQLDMLV